MIEVTKEVFLDFLKDKDTTEQCADNVHGAWIVENEKKIAYYESSSWGAETTYLIESKQVEHVNFNALWFFTNLLNRKLL